MTRYKIISKKSGRFRDDLTLEDALLLTKLTQPQFLHAYQNGHPTFTIIQLAAPAPPPPAPEKADDTPKGATRAFWQKKRYVLSGGFLALLFIAAALTPPAEDDASSGGQTHQVSIADTLKACRVNVAELQVAAQWAIRQSLKSPNTAKFPSGSDYQIADAGKCEFIVTSFVDAQNGFSATVRTDYIAHMKTAQGKVTSAEIIAADQR